MVDGQGSYTNAAALSSITARAAPSASTVAASVRPATPARRRATTRNASDETVNGKLLHVCFRFRVEFSCASDRSVLCPRFATYIGCINPIVFSATLTTTMAIKNQHNLYVLQSMHIIIAQNRKNSAGCQFIFTLSCVPVMQTHQDEYIGNRGIIHKHLLCRPLLSRCACKPMLFSCAENAVKHPVNEPSRYGNHCHILSLILMRVCTRAAVRDLPLGAECDEINELKYCARGLVCQRCMPHDPVFRCLRCQLIHLSYPLPHLSSSYVPPPRRLCSK